MGTAITGKNHRFTEELTVPESNLSSDNAVGASQSALAQKVVDWSGRVGEGYEIAVDGVKSAAKSVGKQVTERPYLSAAIAGLIGGAIGYAMACRARK